MGGAGKISDSVMLTECNELFCASEYFAGSSFIELLVLMALLPSFIQVAVQVTFRTIRNITFSRPKEETVHNHSHALQTILTPSSV